MIDVYDKTELMRDLSNGQAQCDLVHGKGYTKEDTVAVDYIVLPMGVVKDEAVTDNLVLSVCKYCVEAMYDQEWVLLVCKSCGDTRWVWRNYSKLDYRNKETGQSYDIVIFEGCPTCTGAMEGIYFYTHDQFMGQDEIN